MNLEHKTAVLSAPAVTAVSDAFQFTLWPFAIGFVFAFSRLIDMDRSSFRMGLFIVARSSLISGAVSQILAPFILLAIGHYLPWALEYSQTKAAHVGMTMLLSIILALTTHKVLPRLDQLIGEYRRPDNG